MATPLRITRSLVVLSTWLFLLAPSLWADESRRQSPALEEGLIAVLRSDAPKADKAIACKRLAIHGSRAAVPELAKLLADEELASWSRTALEAIPGPESDKALLDAAEQLDGKLLVGVINSIGVRKDTRAVELLATRLQDNDAEVASAAAVALGHIGGQKAAKPLRAALTKAPANVRSAVAEGCILCAEKLHAEGKSAEAARIYDEVRKAEVPPQRVLEATRGAILARDDEGISLLVAELQSADKGRFQMALSTAREFPGDQVDRALASALTKAEPERAALLIQAMADRPESVVLPAVFNAARQGPKPVRVAALAALARVGDDSCLATLLEIALDADPDLAQMAKTTLAELPGEKVDAKIVAMLPDAEGKTQPLLLEIVGKRRIAATAALLQALDQEDPAVRGAALTALGETVAFEDLPALVSQVVAPRNPQDAQVARRALQAAAIRMPDREACAAELSAAIEQIRSEETKGALVEILGEMGGATALATVGNAAKSSNPQLQDIGTRLLGKWMTADAAPVLLDLATTLPAGKYQIRALRGYIRIARQFDLPQQQRTELCRKALDASTRPEEKIMVLDVLQRYPTAENLQLATDAMHDAALKEKAAEVAITIAQNLGVSEKELKELLSAAAFEPVELEIVQAEYGAGANQRDVTASLQQQVGELRLITLSSPNYNASFGGDPAPGTPKQLKIRYRINAKEGEASFAENSPILLPVPK